MRFPRLLLSFAVLGLAACGPTYVVQGTPQPAPQRVPDQPPPPPRVPPLEVSVVRPEEGRVLVQTSRAAYVAVFEIVPGRGVSLVYPQPMRQREVMLTGLNYLNVSWTMRPRFASNDTRYVYVVGSDTPLLLSDDMYDARYLERRLGSTYWASSPNATAHAISREFVRSQPDEWWGEDMYAVPLRDGRMDVIVHVARVYCPGGVYYDVREEVASRVWCPARRGGRGNERPTATEPDSVFNAIGRRVPRQTGPNVRTPIFRVPTPTEVGQQGQPANPPAPPRGYPRTQPQNPTVPAQNQPPQNQPPQSQPAQNQPPQSTPNDQNGSGKDHDDNGRRAHGDPRNADPRGNGNGYGNGGREAPPTQQPVQTNLPQPQQQGQPQGQQQGQPQGQQQGRPNLNPFFKNGGNNGNNGNSANNNGNNGNNGNTNNGNGKAPNDAKPGHDDAPKSAADLIRSRAPGQQKKQDDKKAANDSTDAKKKP